MAAKKKTTPAKSGLGGSTNATMGKKTYTQTGGVMSSE